MTERGLAYDVFAPLWGISELAAVSTAGARSLEDVSLTDFVRTRRAELDRVLEAVRLIGGFSADTMAVFERQGGWNSDGEVTPESLMLYSGCIEAYPPDTGDPAVLRRMLRMGADLQSTALMDALVGVATVRGPGPAKAPGLIVDAVREAGELLGTDGGQLARDAFRMWRVAHLPSALRPNAPTPPEARERVRAYAHALEELLEGA
ncbi:hypothetical protein [Streptomyces sp. NPDC003832]